MPSDSQNSLRRKADAMRSTTQQFSGNARPPSDPIARDLGEKLSRNGTPSSTKAPSTYDASYLSPPKGGKFRPAIISNSSRSGSEADSLLDLYGRDRSVAEGTERSDRDVTLEDLYLDQEDFDSSRWIHRDKLAVIESHELQEAGIKLPGQRRSKSSLRHKRSHSRNQSTPSVKDPEPEIPIAREGKRQKVRSPVRQQIQEDPVNYDLRMPEEIASESLPQNGPTIMYHQPNLGRSGSKIPLHKTSPLPIAQGYIDRSAPLPRNRGASGTGNGGDEEGFSYNQIRSRSNSVGSNVLLHAPEVNGTLTPAQRPGSRDGLLNSPPKQRSVSKPGSVSNARPKTSNGPRNMSEPQKLRPSPSLQRSSPGFPRPKSRNGLEARPATAVNRPEGEAPWIADMYKPDPRLPPEQQMLPTHAKRLQEEQRERELREAGMNPQQLQQPAPATLIPDRPVGITRTPSPMAANNKIYNAPPSPPNYSSQQSPQDLPRVYNPPPPERTNTNSPSSGQWPLKVAPPIKPPSIKPTNNNNKTSTSNSPISPDQHHGGYSTIPKVQSTPPIGSASSPMMPQAMVQEKPRGKEERGKEKGCGGCCVVM
ncbi:MAG: hypothetical protein LQ343_000511 [Gyalolechia ehrenbergii]|nr:MAG: hypothetical protein LQ343_000511 [Gyalolechia ehrenbergii]